MIVQLLGKLFSSSYLDKYVAHPIHLLWSLLIMAIGVITFTENGYFGAASFILGGILGISICVSIAWEKSIEYWNTVTEFANVMMKSNNPDLWQALGFKAPPQQVIVKEVKEASTDNGWQMKIHRLPVSPATMQLVADTVLHSGNTDFIESDFAHIPNIRKIRNHLKAEGLLSPKNKKNVRLGYTFNRKGLDTLYQYASEGVKLELRKRSKDETER